MSQAAISEAPRYFSPNDDYEVSREDVRAFARALQVDAPPRPADGAPLDPDSVPPTFVVKIGTQAVTWLTTELLADHPVGAFLHTEQAFTYARPVRIGDRLRISLEVQPIRPKAGGEIVAFDTHVTNQHDEEVLSARTSLFSRVSPETTAIAKAAVATLGPRLSRPFLTWTPTPELPTPAAGSAPHPPTTRPLAAGELLPPWTTTLTLGDVVNYAGTSGDLNPIHWNPEIARLVGLDSPLAHGMLTMGMGASYLSAALGSAECFRDYRVRFTGATPISLDGGTEVTYSARVKEAGERETTLALTATVAGRRIFGRATATVATG